MATLRLEDDTILADLSAIAAELAPLNIQLNQWEGGNDAQLHSLLAKAHLTDDEKESILVALDGYFQQLQHTAGYQTRDLIVLHPDVPNLDALLAKFDRIHTHAEDEVRYILDGAGVFGFVRLDGSQVELTVAAADYISVPAGTDHWFYLTPQRRIKAIRYFTGTAGWTPQYTETKIRSQSVLA